MAKQPQRPQARSQAPQPQQPAPTKKPGPAPARSAAEKKDALFHVGNRDLIYGRKNFVLMGAGLALILAGLAAMSGGAMPDPNVWEPERIYSFTRITLAPILMVAGFVVVVFGIFKKNTPMED
jgi:predicted cobalt transporter CbtA